jgi:hypothetical protein
MFAQIILSLLILLNPLTSAFLPPVRETLPVRVTALSAPPSGEDGLLWQADRRLSWDDFQSEADQQQALHAMTSTNIEVQANCQGNQVQFAVRCVFKTKDSWSKNKQSLRLLAHEQMHFDLTEVHARQLRQVLSRATGLCGSRKSQFSAIVEDQFAKWKTEQDLYDLESNHGLNQEQQLAWEAKIAHQLQQLAAFAYAGEN